MREFAFIFAKEAAPKVRSGSYADGMAVLESWERLVKSTSSALSQNKRSICLCFGRRSVTSALESAQNFMKIKIHHKDKHFFRNFKFDHNQYRSHPNNLEWLLNVLNMNAR